MTTSEETDRNNGTQTNVVLLPQASGPESARTWTIAFVREHPVLVIAGGLAAGAVAAALIPRRNRQYVTRQSSLLAEAIAAAGTAIAQQALANLNNASTTVQDRAQVLAARAEEAGGAVLDRSERARNAAYDRALTLLGRKRPAPTLSARVASRAGKLARRLRG
jgi:hypothetical protein